MKEKIIIIISVVLSIGLLSMSVVALNVHLIIIVFIGIISSFIGTLAGGGGLITLPAMMLTGIPIQTSIATNKFSSGVAAFSSVFYLLHQKQLSLKTISQNVVIAILGGVAGALVTTHLSEKTMNVIAMLLLFFAFVVSVKNKGWIEKTQGDPQKSIHGRRTSFVLFSIAAYDGGFGPGSSTFGILYYMKKQETYLKAVQLTRVLIFGSCSGAFIIFYQSGFIQWSYALGMAFGSILGSQLGLLVLPKVPMKMAKGLLMTIMFFLIMQMGFKLI